MAKPAYDQKTLIYDLNLDDLEKAFAAWGEPSYRARQVWQGLYRQFWDKAEEFSMLPAKLRARLGETFLFTPLCPIRTLESSDRQTVKTLFELVDGQAIETVLMRYDDRRTLCISTQVGCGMGCVFCATGQMGFRRHLSSGEIVAQVIHYARLLHQQEEKVSNVVIMGMGEPFHNYESTLAAIDRLNHPDGMNLGERRFTISTVGLIPTIRRFTNEKRQINLAISLHASEDELRSSMLPVNKKYPIKDLIEACREYVAVTGRRITFEWALIQGVNDSVGEARKLAKLLKGLLCHVNVIPLNPTRMFDGKSTTRERAQAFKDALQTAGIPCTIRIRRGIDIQAGCGQLASRFEKENSA
ncbi:MAG: 23S rRNA (adenine(2503)-C(2))-methyltransferase RlmN [Anaerolineae bacterium]|nr:23S rRNA (adenine(2503)-C(2))-methyltransferase RlmN [Anaerolineae bacterium]